MKKFANNAGKRSSAIVTFFGSGGEWSIVDPITQLRSYRDQSLSSRMTSLVQQTLLYRSGVLDGVPDFKNNDEKIVEELKGACLEIEKEMKMLMLPNKAQKTISNEKDQISSPSQEDLEQYISSRLRDMAAALSKGNAHESAKIAADLATKPMYSKFASRILLQALEARDRGGERRSPGHQTNGLLASPEAESPGNGNGIDNSNEGENPADMSMGVSMNVSMEMPMSMGSSSDGLRERRYDSDNEVEMTVARSYMQNRKNRDVNTNTANLLQS